MSGDHNSGGTHGDTHGGVTQEGPGSNGPHGDVHAEGHDDHASGEHADGGHGSSHCDGAGHQLIVNIAYCTVSAGLIALIMHKFDLPLLLGYILGGVLVGPIGLKLIESSVEINTISELGLILLLFMIGLELDVSELLKMGKVVLITGFVQFPICAMVHLGIFMFLEAVGINYGVGDYATMYMAVCCGISSTMIVVKLLGIKME